MPVSPNPVGEGGHTTAFLIRVVSHWSTREGISEIFWIDQSNGTRRSIPQVNSIISFFDGAGTVRNCSSFGDRSGQRPSCFSQSPTSSLESPYATETTTERISALRATSGPDRITSFGASSSISILSQPLRFGRKLSQVLFWDSTWVNGSTLGCFSKSFWPVGCLILLPARLRRRSVHLLTAAAGLGNAFSQVCQAFLPDSD